LLFVVSSKDTVPVGADTAVVAEALTVPVKV
jgi:hypothetical protein